jgi:ketosteroid isomerase-like protein
MQRYVYARDEVEGAFKTYVLLGLVNEDWAAWSRLFTDDAVYIDHYWGTFRGPEEIRLWNEVTTAAVPETYTAVEWYAIDGNRVIVRSRITADNPEPGGPPFLMPLLQCLEYGGDGKWRSEEDFWILGHARDFGRKYDEARQKFDPEHPKRMSRLDWGPYDWARPLPGATPKPSWLTRANLVPVRRAKDLTVGERHPW